MHSPFPSPQTETSYLYFTKSKRCIEKDGWRADFALLVESKRKADEIESNWNETWQNDGRYGMPIDGKVYLGRGKYAGEEQEESYRNKRRAVKESRKMRTISKRRAVKENKRPVKQLRKCVREDWDDDGLSLDIKRIMDDEDYRYVIRRVHEESEGNPDYIPDYDELTTYITYEEEISREDYDKLVRAYLKLLEGVKMYDGRLELSDKPVLDFIDTEIDWREYETIARDFLTQFERENDVEVETLGRSSRHICVENTLRNLIRYDELVDAVDEKIEEMIDFINNLSDDGEE